MNIFCDKHNTSWNDKNDSSCPRCQEQERVEQPLKLVIKDLLEDSWYLLQCNKNRSKLFDKEYQDYENKFKRYFEHFKL